MITAKACALSALGALLVGCGGGGGASTSTSTQPVTRFTITGKQSPAFNGQEFGSAGKYELLTGTAEVELDPADPKNAIITDMELAPKLANGKVRYTTTVSIAKPMDMAKASGLLFHANANRGTGTLTATDTYPSGNAYGDVEVAVGWQAEVATNSTHRVIEAPVARNADGSDVTGVVLARMADMAAGTNTVTLQVLGREIPYDSTMDKTKARLNRKTSETRLGVNGPTSEVPAADWAFADCTGAAFPGTANPRKLCLRNGFDPQYLYEMVYEVKNPIVLGVGLAALRDVNSFLRYETVDAEGTANPLAGSIKKAVIFGVSQSGNVLKTFLNLGFNQDLRNRIVFDGANPHIAGRQTTINVRFGMPSGSGTLYEPGGEGVLWWDSYADKARKNRVAAGLLDRCKAGNTCPKIFETFGSSEFVGRLMSVALTGTDGKEDLSIPGNVRRYYFPGTTHGGGGGGVSAVQASPGTCVLSPNPNPETEQVAALRSALRQWVLSGTEPPPSRYPTLKEQTLAAATNAGVGFPVIPGAPRLDGLAIPLIDYDFGSPYRYNDLSGVITQLPPAIGAITPAYMPVVDADGNETSGYPSVLHKAPLGTYTGWNPTAAGWFKGQPCGGGLNGGFIAFRATLAERVAAGDPRPSLEERYGTAAGYVCAISKATREEVAKRLLLPADAASLISQAQAANVLPTTSASPTAQALAQALCQGV